MDKKSGMTVCEICSSTDNVLVFYQYIANKKNSIYICQTCASMLGIEKNITRVQPVVGDLFTAVFDPDGVDEKDNKVCENCGSSYVQIRHWGLVGCSECYDVFKEEIADLLRRVSSKHSHQGRLPRRLWKVKNVLIEKPALYQQLQQAVQREDYEEAKNLKQAIEDIETE